VSPLSFYLATLCFALFVNYDGIASLFKKLFKKQLDEMRNEILTSFVKHDFLWSILEGHVLEAGSEFGWRLGVLRNIYKCKMYVEKYKWHMLSLGVVLPLAYSWFSRSPSCELFFETDF